jgi:DUF4097 and DUF4098 domain-containing protein YvlB
MIDQTFSIESDPRIEVKIASGEVRLLPGEEGAIRVVADARADAGLDVSQRGSTIEVTTERRRGWLRSDDARVTAYLPAGTEADISTASADIVVRAQVARLAINTASGDVAIDEAGEANIKTASGDVRCRVLEGPSQIVSASGDISIDRCSEKASFSAASGDIAIKEATGPIVRASTASGDVIISRCRVTEVECKSMSGSVALGIPPRTRVNLDAHTLSGEVRLPSPAGGQQDPESTIVIKARLVSGDLKVFRAS